MALIICSECGKQVDDKAVACPHCGAPLVMQTMEEPKIICEECGNEISSGAEICPNCGAPVAQPTETHKIPTMPVLAADIPGTVASPTYDPDSESKTHKIAGLVALILMALSTIGLLFVNTIKLPDNVTKIPGYEPSTSLWSLLTGAEMAKMIMAKSLERFFDNSALKIEMIIMLIISFIAIILILIAAAEFYIPRKNDIKYEVNVRRGWYIMLILGIIYSTVCIISVVTMKADSVLGQMFDYNIFFYIFLVISVGIIVMSAIMIFKLKKNVIGNNIKRSSQNKEQ